MDGGVSNNTPISHAIDAGATTVYVLPTGYACALSSAPQGALAMALQSITLLVQQRLIADVARYQGKLDLRVMPPLCPLSVSPLDFSHTSELIERSRASTARWLDSTPQMGDQTDLLRLHRHSPSVPEPARTG